MAYSLHLFVAGETVTATTLNAATYYNDSFLGGTDGHSGVVGVGPMGSGYATADAVINSATYADLDSMTVTLTLFAGELLVLFHAKCDIALNFPAYMQCIVEGTGGGTDEITELPATNGYFVWMHHYTGLAAASHNIKIQFKGDGSHAVTVKQRSLVAIGIRV